jgi:hypothetical protein
MITFKRRFKGSNKRMTQIIKMTPPKKLTLPKLQHQKKGNQPHRARLLKRKRLLKRSLSKLKLNLWLNPARRKSQLRRRRKLQKTSQ